MQRGDERKKAAELESQRDAAVEAAKWTTKPTAVATAVSSSSLASVVVVPSAILPSKATTDSQPSEGSSVTASSSSSSTAPAQSTKVATQVGHMIETEEELESTDIRTLKIGRRSFGNFNPHIEKLKKELTHAKDVSISNNDPTEDDLINTFGSRYIKGSAKRPAGGGGDRERKPENRFSVFEDKGKSGRESKDSHNSKRNQGGNSTTAATGAAGSTKVKRESESETGSSSSSSRIRKEFTQPPELPDAVHSTTTTSNNNAAKKQRK